jgi:hypothetical protein
MKYLIQNHDDLINVHPYYLSNTGLRIKLAVLRLESGYYEDEDERGNLIDIIASSYRGTSKAADADSRHKNWLLNLIRNEEKTITDAKEEAKKNQEYTKETQLELELGVPNV